MFLYKMIMQNITVIVVSLIIGGLIACHTICGCSTISKEGFSEGAPLDWKMSDGVPGDSWSQPPVTPEQIENMYVNTLRNYQNKRADDPTHYPKEKSIPKWLEKKLLNDLTTASDNMKNCLTTLTCTSDKFYSSQKQLKQTLDEI